MKMETILSIRKALAVTTGVLLALIAAWPAKTEDWELKEAVIGLALGTWMTLGMLRGPGNITLAIVGFVSAPLMSMMVLLWSMDGGLRDPALQLSAVDGFISAQAAFAVLSR